MEIGATSLAALNAVLPSFAPAGSSAGAGSTFGPAAVLSLDGGAANAFSQLAGLYARPASPVAPPLSKAETDKVETAFDLIEANDLDAAAVLLDELVDANPRNAAAVQGLGLIALANDDFTGAEKLFRRADFLAPGRGSDLDAENARILQGDDATIVESARRLIANAETRSKGVQLLLKYTERRGDDAEAQLLLGEGLLAIGESNEGISRVLTALDAGDRALVARVEGRFERLVKLAPRRADLLGVLGRAQRMLGKFDDAIASFDRAEALSEGEAIFNTDRAQIEAAKGREFLERGDVTRALAAFESARALDAADPGIRESLAEGYLARGLERRRLGQLGKSVLDFREAARLTGRDGSESLRRRIGIAAFDAGLRLERRHEAAGEDVDEEVIAFQAAYDVDPDNKAYKRRLADTRKTIGDQFAADGKLEQAVGAYQMAHALYENDAGYRSALVEGYRQLGQKQRSQNRYTDAIATFTKAWKLDAGNTIIKGHLAEAYNARGVDYRNRNLFTKAVRDFKEAIRLEPDNGAYQANYDGLSSYDL